MWFCFAVSDANVLVETQLCDIAFPKGLFGTFGQFSTALLLPSDFSDRRFETAPDLSFQSAKKRCRQSGNELEIRDLEWQLTKRLRQIRNAGHFRFALKLVFTAQWLRLGGSVAHYLTRRYTANLLIYTLMHSLVCCNILFLLK